MNKDMLPPQVLEALKAGNKIEAIKLLRGMTGQGLKEAKDWIDSHQPAGRDANSSFTLTREAFEALKHGNKIEAVKIVRQATGVGLTEAKHMVDEIEKAIPKVAKPAVGARAVHTPTPLRRPGLAPGEVGSTGGPGKWLALIAVAVIAVVVGMYY